MAGDDPFAASVPKDELRPNSKDEKVKMETEGATGEAGTGGEEGSTPEQDTVEAVLACVFSLFQAFANRSFSIPFTSIPFTSIPLLFPCQRLSPLS